MSPLIWQWKVLGERLERVRAWQWPEVLLAHGFHAAEGAAGEAFPIWTDGDARVQVETGGALPVRLIARYSDLRPDGWPQPEVSLLVNGASLPHAAVEFDTAGEPRVLHAVIGAPGGDLRPRVPWGSLELGILSATWVPAEATDSGDKRKLGIFLHDLTVDAGGRALSVGTPLVPTLPVTESARWSHDAFWWFVIPEGQLLDMWWWHLYFSGLPRRLSALAIVPTLGLLISGLLLARSERSTSRPNHSLGPDRTQRAPAPNAEGVGKPAPSAVTSQ